MTKKEEVLKEFEETKLVKWGGSCFECCDYETMCGDIKLFLSRALDQMYEAGRHEATVSFQKHWDEAERAGYRRALQDVRERVEKMPREESDYDFVELKSVLKILEELWK